MTRINDKRTMYDMLRRGCFGNYMRNWPSLAAAAADGYRGLISLRSLQVSNPVKLYHVPFDQVEERLAALPADQRNSGIVYCEAPDDTKRTVQGEVAYLPGVGLYLLYSTVPLPMRFALEKEQIELQHSRARWMLQSNLDPACFENLMDLLDRYDGAAVEFSGFSVPVGVLSTKSVVWEVRHY